MTEDDLREFWHRLPDRVAMWIAWALPRRIAYWAAIRVMAHGTRVHDHSTPDEISIMDTLKAWDQPA